MKAIAKQKKFSRFIKTKIGYIYLFLMFGTSGITTVLTKYLINDGLSAVHILTYTSLIGMLILLLVNIRTVTLKNFKTEIGLKWIVIAALSGFALYELSFNMALQYMSVTQTIVIYYVHPIFLYFAGLFFLKDYAKRFDYRVLVGILLSLLGIYFVLNGGTIDNFKMNIGLIFVFISIICVTIFTIQGKLMEIPEKQFLFVGQTIAFITGCVILTLNNSWGIPSKNQIIYLIFIAIVYNLINMLFYIKTIQFLSVEKLSTLTYLSPVVTSLLAVWILKEPLIATTVAGLLLVIMGNFIAGSKNI